MGTQPMLHVLTPQHLSPQCLFGVSVSCHAPQALFLDFLRASPDGRRSVRRDIVAVRERDPACTSYHDALLYFKGFQVSVTAP
jgi:serine acetyltransferase